MLSSRSHPNLVPVLPSIAAPAEKGPEIRDASSSSRRQLIPGRCDNYQQRTCRSRGHRQHLMISNSYATNLLRTASSAQGCVRNPEENSEALLDIGLKGET